MSPPVVHPPLPTVRVGQHGVREVRPTECDGGHPYTVDVVGWHPCMCGGHRVYWCGCGLPNHFHARPEPRPRCSEPVNAAVGQTT